VAGDLSPANLGVARATYGPRVPLVRFDAQALPFASRTLTAVVCLEGLYFLPSVDAFLAEARRVLHADGTLLVSVVNRDCPGFDPSNPAYARTYGAPELAADLERHGFEVTMFATTVMDARGARARWLRAAKAVAVALRLIPRDMTSPWKRVLRRLAFGPLVPLPAELPSDCPTGDEVAPIATTSRDATHQALLALGRAARP
jgi:ubiquinone/menaquinone biosynthesis C-methylase UbiE